MSPRIPKIQLEAKKMEFCVPFMINCESNVLTMTTTMIVTIPHSSTYPTYHGHIIIQPSASLILHLTASSPFQVKIWQQYAVKSECH